MHQVRNFGYQLGDALGDYSPDFMRRPMLSIGRGGGWLIGFGSLAAAIGIGFLALRIADRRLGDVIQNIIPRYGSENGHRKRPTVHGTRGAEMPDVEDVEGRRGQMQGQIGNEPGNSF